MINSKWYMISTFAGKEEVVIETLKEKIGAETMEAYFDEFKIFWESQISNTELQKKQEGKDYKVKQKNIYNGYIFIKMNMTDEAWFLVRNTEYVTGLIGSSGRGTKPTPISDREIRKMFDVEKLKQKEFEALKFTNPFPKNTFVNVNYGAFMNQKGVVIESNVKTKKAIVEIETFGKKVPTEFSFKALKKVENE